MDSTLLTTLSFIAPIIAICIFSALIIAKQRNLFKNQDRLAHQLERDSVITQEKLEYLKSVHDSIQKQNMEQQRIHQEQRQQFDQHQINSLTLIQDSLAKGMTEVRQQVTHTLTQHSQTVSDRLKEISGQVDKRLNEGFEKTNATFTSVIKRLTIIDEAQKKITELSSNVVSLQSVLSDKRSRGAFGEVQLNGLIRNMLPEKHFALQYELSTKVRVDCMLFLPEPTGNMSIDAKFPLESYQRLADETTAVADRPKIKSQFRQDIRKHLRDIAEKYIIPGETSDGAMMFIPAEAIFAEIHSHYPDLVEEAHKARVWMVSPTTMMAILTTARAVLKDAATRKQVHIIQEHLNALGKDFGRFQKRMDNLVRHIQQANEDVEQVHKSSKKITGRFQRIEEVELSDDEKVELALIEDDV
jgi:DNA recombination protein RmuC